MTTSYQRIIPHLTKWLRKYHWWVAGGLLAAMAALGISAMVGNSAIVDEQAHIPAAYALLHYGDYRLNPEHPPLMKDLAALPLQFMHLKGFNTLPEWTSAVNGEWQAGDDFLYNLGNNAGAILFWSRLPIALVMIGFGLWLYWVVRRRWGLAVALLALVFYAFSPNILANGTLVTTDLGAAVFIFIALIAFGRFMKAPTASNVWILSAAIALAELAKFSAAILYPFLGTVSVVLWLVTRRPAGHWPRFKQYVGGFLAACVLSVVWIYLVYAPQVRHMPVAVQDNLITNSLVSSNVKPVADILVNASHVPLAKPLAQYALGLAMDTGRIEGGNTTYFNGQVSNQSFHGFFPELFVLKTQIALLVLMLVTIGVGVWRWYRTRRTAKRWVNHFRAYGFEWVLGSFAAFYFTVATVGNLDLGLRHILPIYLPIFVLVALGAVRLGRRLARTRWAATSGAVLALLLVWYVGSTLWVAPSYLSYFNEFIGGPANAYQYFTDSNVDWGQDLLRLQTYVDNHPQIKHIAVDYFGGAVPAYYFCRRAYNPNGTLITTGKYNCADSKFEEWHVTNGHYTGQYLAVSETYLENDRYYSGIAHRPGYAYLRAMKPIAKIGYSIYVYKLY